MSEVSGNSHRPPVRDRQTKIRSMPRKAGKTTLARVVQREGYAECSCGWAKVHKRDKVVGDAAERHVNKAHGGRAIWM